jgi:hypothetical protein
VKLSFVTKSHDCYLNDKNAHHNTRGKMNNLMDSSTYSSTRLRSSSSSKSPNSSYASLSKWASMNEAQSSTSLNESIQSSSPSLLTSRSSSVAGQASLSIRRSSSSLFLQGLSSISLNGYDHHNTSFGSTTRLASDEGKDSSFSSHHNMKEMNESSSSLSRQIDSNQTSCERRNPQAVTMTPPSSSVSLGLWIPNWVQNVIIFAGLYHQSLVVIVMMYLIQSATLSFPRLDNRKWIPFLAAMTKTTNRNSSGTLEQMEQYYANNYNQMTSHSEDSLNARLGTPRAVVSSSSIKKSTSDEWGHFTDFDESIVDIGELNPIVPVSKPVTTSLAANNNSTATVQLGTLHEMDEDDDDNDR